MLYGYSDSDWNGDIDTSRSTTGYSFLLAGGSITWNSRLQRSVSLSSTEAEYMAMCAAAQEMLYLKQLLLELLQEQNSGPIILYEDNQGCMALAERPAFQPRTRHIRMRYHFVRELIEEREFVIEYCPTSDMAADIFTKALSFDLFAKHREVLMNVRH